VDSPLKWVGGKSRLRAEIVPLIPAHRTYAEPFAGAAWVLFGKPQSPVEYLNDVDNELVNLYLVIRDHLDDLMTYLAATPTSEYIFRTWIAPGYAGEVVEETARVINGGYISTTGDSDIPMLEHGDEVHGGISQVAASTGGIPKLQQVGHDVEAAARMYYRTMNAYNGNLTRQNLTFSVSAGRPGGTTVFNRTDWLAVRQRLRNVTLLNKHFREVMDALDAPETLFYLDPPYLCAADNDRYYRYTLTAEDHELLPIYLGDLRGKFILSMGDEPRVRSWYRDFNVIESELVPGELFILNYEPPDPPFYRNLVGSVYRTGPWTEPNCPYCGSRDIQVAYKRVTLAKGKRNWPTIGWTCNKCKELWR